MGGYGSQREASGGGHFWSEETSRRAQVSSPSRHQLHSSTPALCFDRVFSPLNLSLLLLIFWCWHGLEHCFLPLSAVLLFAHNNTYRCEHQFPTRPPEPPTPGNPTREPALTGCDNYFFAASASHCMAWQSPSAMSGGGGFVGPGGDANGPQGTEYTLQGRSLARENLVSPFLIR